MPAWKRFEDIDIWRLAREICRDIWNVTRQKSFDCDSGLVRQMLNSSGSIMDNVAEGFERGTNGEFKTFVGYAKASAGELRSQLLRAHDRKFLTDDEIELIEAKVMRFSRQSKALIRRLNEHPGGFRIQN